MLCCKCLQHRLCNRNSECPLGLSRGVGGELPHEGREHRAAGSLKVREDQSPALLGGAVPQDQWTWGSCVRRAWRCQGLGHMSSAALLAPWLLIAECPGGGPDTDR